MATPLVNLAAPFLDPHDYQFVVTAGRAATDKATCNFLGQSVKQLKNGNPAWDYPSMTYGNLATAILAQTNLEYRTYSARNSFGTFIDQTRLPHGYYMSVQNFITAVYATGLDNSGTIANIPGVTTFQQFINTFANALITLNSGGYEISILGSQVFDGGGRWSFAESSPISYDAGFLLVMDQDPNPVVPADPFIRFVVGQRAAGPSPTSSNDVNSPMLVTLSDGGFTISFTQMESLPKWNDFRAFVGAVGSAGTSYISSITPNTITGSTLLRFAIDQNDLLNRSIFYYTVSDEAAVAPNPPTDLVYDGMFNLPSPQFAPGGVNYGNTDGSVVPEAAEVPIDLESGNEYYFRVKAIGFGAEDSNLMEFVFIMK